MIRVAKFKDLETIVDFQLLMAKETEGIDLDREAVITGAEAIFEDPSKGTYYVVEKDNEVVACLLTTPEWSEWRNSTVLWIQSVYVKKGHRGQGIFKALYQFLKEFVEASDDLSGLRLYVEKHNEDAQKVYRSLGMNDQHYLLFEWMK